MQKIRLLFFVLFLFFETLIAASPYISVEIFWASSFLNNLVPLLILLNLLLLILKMRINTWRMYLHSILIIIVCIPSILPVISFGGKSANHREEISIFSFNAKFFRKRNTYEKFSERTISAVVQQDSDIKCIQEFSTNSKWKVLDVTSRIRSQGYYSYIFKAEVPESDHNPGLAIFSKFPIVTSGIVWQEPGIHHAGIFTDIKIREDTIRVYNVHFAYD